MHQLCDSFGSLSLCPSLSFCVVSSNPLLLVLYFPTHSLWSLSHVLIDSLCLSMLIFSTSTRLDRILLRCHLVPSVSHPSCFLPRCHISPTCDFFPHFPALIGHLPSSHPTHRSLNGLSPTIISPPLPLPLSPPLSLYLARSTSIPPWVLQTPVWKLKVEGEVVEAEEEER